MLTHSIVMTVYNVPDDVRLCLQSIAHSLDLSRVELVIVDDCSKEETRKILDDFVAKNPSAMLVRHEKNQGYLHSVNDGIAHTHGDVITLLNSDTYIPGDFSARILACFEQDEKIGVASPVLTHGNPFSVPVTRSIPQKIYLEKLPSWVASMNEKAKNITPQYPDIVFPDGACFSIRRQCIEMVGCFNEAYSPGYFEELDFCMKVLQKGYRCVFIENLYVYHKSHASFGQKKTSKYMERNQKRFYTDWDTEYTGLKNKYPKKEHKKRVFCAFYPFWYYVFVESLLKISRIIPSNAVRRKIRALYQ